MCGTGSLVRKAMLNSAAPEVDAPPGLVDVATGPGFRYAPVAGSQRPTPAAMRTVLVPGSHAECGTSTVIWRRARSTLALGAGELAAPVSASVSSAVLPWTVRNSCAGDATPAPCGHGSGTGESPSAIVVAVR